MQQPTIMLVSYIVCYYWVDLLDKAFSHKASSWGPPPLFFAPRNYINPLYRAKLFTNSSSTTFKTTKKYKMSQCIYGNTDCFNTKYYLPPVPKTSPVTKEKSEILAWLSPLEPQRRHSDIRTSRIDEVGDWLLQTKKYRNWLGGFRGGKSDSSALFCYGGPGVGKTYIR